MTDVARSSWPLFRALVGTGIACSLLIVSVYELTRPIIAANQQQALAAAIFEVLPGAETTRELRWSPGEQFVFADELSTADSAEQAGDSVSVLYAAYDSGSGLVGFAVEAGGMGYADVIRVLYGYDPHRHAIVGMRVLESRETPGLGDRIETDAAFLENFAALDVQVSPDSDQLANPIAAVKRGHKVHPWQVDAITGATISSFAIADILDESASTWIPRLARLSRTLEAARAANHAEVR